MIELGQMNSWSDRIKTVTERVEVFIRRFCNGYYSFKTNYFSIKKSTEMWSGDHSIPETEKELKRSSLSKDISLFLKSTESGDRIAASHSVLTTSK